MVNLKKSKYLEDSVEFNLSDQIMDRFGGHFGLREFVQILVRIAFVSIAIVSLKIYNIYYIKKLNAQKGQIQLELNAKQDEIKKLDQQINAYADLTNKADEFQKKFKVLKQLADDRLRIIKVLDSIQSGMGFNDDDGKIASEFLFFKNISIINRALTIRGSTNNVKSIQEFLISLEEENLYDNIQLENVTSDQKGQLKNFLVKGTILETI